MFATRRLSALQSPPSTTLIGIDGLYATPWGLISVQNSTDVHQVVRVLFRPDHSVACAQVIELLHPAHEVPTTGTVVGSTLYYVANSQLPRLGNAGRPADPNELRRTVILRLVSTLSRSKISGQFVGRVRHRQGGRP